MPAASTIDVPRLATRLTARDVLKRWSLRWGIGRDTSRVEPGLYRVGEPTPDSPVLVTANYRMTVDHVRADLHGRDVWLLVLETYGINVWCAAGKGTFGTKEVVARVLSTGLPDHVAHETLVLPQLGAPGVAAHEVRRLTGYRVVWGPVRSADLPAFLDAGLRATDEMRAVTFTFAERIALAPVELVGAFHGWRLALPAALVALSAIGPGVVSLDALTSRALAALLVALSGVLAGTVALPALLPWVPGRAFALKGALLGALLGTATAALLGEPFLATLGLALVATALGSYLGMNFTGCTPYTSPSGVERELRRWLPVQATLAAIGVLGWIASAWLG